MTELETNRTSRPEGFKGLDPITATLTGIECVFNTTNSLPFVAIVFGPLRAAFGTTQIISGIAVAIIGAIAAKCSTHPQNKLQCKALSYYGILLIAHGTMNIFRGGVETIGVGLLGILSPLAIYWNFFYEPKYMALPACAYWSFQECINIQEGHQILKEARRQAKNQAIDNAAAEFLIS